MSIPSIPRAITLMALTRGWVGSVILAITVVDIPRVLRLVRAVALSLREQPAGRVARRRHHRASLTRHHQ